MPDKSYNTVVIMPDESRLEVHYYCKNNEVKSEKQAKLFIQLHDCICTLNIEKSLCNKRAVLESIVHNKVINTRGHLC